MGNSKNFFIDGSKLYYHLPVVEKWLKGEQIYPIHAEISPSSGCNQRCILCCVGYKGHKYNSLSRELMLRLAGDFKEAGLKSFLLAGEGEPLLNEHCAEMLKEAKKAGIDAALNTNGVLFSPEMAEDVLDTLTWIRFTIQSPNPERYSFIHGVPESHYHRAIRNIRHSAELKKKKRLDVTIGIQQILINENYDTVLENARLAKELGADYFTVKRFSKHPSNDYDVPEGLYRKSINQFKEAERLSDENFHVLIRWNQFTKQCERRYKKCIGLPFITQILADGGIYPCCQFFGSKELCYGSLYEKRFREIFDSEQAKRITKKIEETTDVSKCMTYCRHHSTNLFLWQFMEKPEHLNFI